METVIEQINRKINSSKLNRVSNDNIIEKIQRLKGTDKSIVLFGSGSLGREILSFLQSTQIIVSCFCDNNETLCGKVINNIPVISFEELKNNHRESLIVIATQKYNKSVYSQLLENKFKKENIYCKPDDPNTPFLFMYAMVGTQNLLNNYNNELGDKTISEFFNSNEESIQKAYEILADKKSKDLLISKLALVASNGDFSLFQDFITNFSEPLHEFGKLNYDGTPEDYYYFNNDVINLSNNETYLDIGAYDGDTVETFIDACNKDSLEYKVIEAFEPDANCYHKLKENTKGLINVNCHQLGLWSQTKTLKFMASENTIHDQAAVISENGNSEIKVVSVDDFLDGKEATFLKMDPGGNIIPEILLGAQNTIQKYKPKLALGAYHGIKSIFEIPIMVKNICPDYKIYLRHNTYHLCDTDMYAVC